MARKMPLHKAAVVVGEMKQALSGASLTLGNEVGHLTLREIQDSIKANGHVDTKRFLQSWQMSKAPGGRGGGAQIKVSTDSPQANILNDGGTIKPKRAKALTIPLTREAKGRRARDFDDLFVLAQTNGHVFLARALATGGVERLFLLKDQVNIRGSKYLDEAMRQVVKKAPAAIEASILNQFNQIISRHRGV